MISEKEPVVPAKLPRKVIRELKNIVGSEWVSEDRAIIESYLPPTPQDFGADLRIHQRDPSLLPACIVLPKSTEEVQAIVRVANRHNITFTPFTNGQLESFPPSLVPTAPKAAILIHLIRMDKILNIDDENMTATVEPYVSYTELQVEAMKRGLWNGGSGWCSAITKFASHIQIAGVYQTDLKYSGLSRQIVSIKMVLPTGELLRLGSAAIAGAGDFTEHFPGPNLIGLARGGIGTRGIIAEVTIKLHPWMGEPYFPEDGTRPSIATYYTDAKENKFDNPPPPKGYKLCWFEYPSLEKLIEGLFKMADSGIGIGLNSTSQWDCSMCSQSEDQCEDRFIEEFFPPFHGYIVLAGVSEKQLEYEEKVLKKILEETGGKLWSREYRPEQLEAVATWNLDCFMNIYGMRCTRRGYYSQIIGCYAGYESVYDYRDYSRDRINREIGSADPFIGTCPGVCPFIYILDRGHMVAIEVDQFPIKSRREEVEKCNDILFDETFWAVSKGYPGAWAEPLGEPFATTLPEVGPNMYLVFRKFRKVLDPKGLECARRVVWSEEEFKSLPDTMPELELVAKCREFYNLPKLKKTSRGDAWKFPPE